jgi:hypothetical protein
MKWLKTCSKSASYVCQRIFVAFGKVNNTQGGDHLLRESALTGHCRLGRCVV